MSEPFVYEGKPIEVGEKFIIWITGCTGKYLAEVTRVEPDVRLKLEDDTVLKPGDYILLEKCEDE